MSLTILSVKRVLTCLMVHVLTTQPLPANSLPSLAFDMVMYLMQQLHQLSPNGLFSLLLRFLLYYSVLLLRWKLNIET